MGGLDTPHHICLLSY